MLPGMADGDRIHLVIDVRRDGEAINGRVVTDDGVGRDFYGWTALAAAIDSAAAPRRDDEDDS
jgi:hypothetical protein